jgi:histidinol-phosphate aminotransferase
MSFITPMVAIGDLGAALDHRLIRTGKIEAVLSMAPVDLRGVVTHHLRLDVVDRGPLPFHTITTAVAFIDGHVRQGRRVLLHCEMGISRSPSLAVCYMHELQGMTIDEALAHVKSIRPRADPHPDLMGSIRAYYRQSRHPPEAKGPRSSEARPATGEGGDGRS